MKLQTLTIHNIASIENAVIDFTAEPLCSSELFLITGETGSGKSTILDAICLALYANTPRLKNFKRGGKMQDGNTDISITDTCQLMRRQAREAFARLSFVGNDGNHYEAEWSVEKKTKNLTRRWKLKNLTHSEDSPDEGNGAGSSKDKPIYEAIQKAIGLDFEQFCRTTMLAQGEFTRFLNSDDKEKAEILEKVTGTDIYAKIGAKLFEITAQHKSEWETAKEKIKGVQTLTEEQIKELNNNVANLKKEIEESQKLEDIEERKIKWLKQEKELSDAVKKAQEAYQKAKEETETDLFRKNKNIIFQWDNTVEQRTLLAQQKIASETIEKKKVDLQNYQKKYQDLLQGKMFFDREISETKEKLTEVEQQLAAEQSKANVYENAQTIIGHLTNLRNARNEIEKQQKKVQQQDDLINKTLTPEYNKLAYEAKELEEQLKKVQDEERTLDTQVQDMHLSSLHKDIDAVNQLLNKFKIAEERITTLIKEQKRYAEVEEQIRQQEKKIDDLQKQITDLEPEVKKAQAKKEECEQHLQNQKKTVEQFAKTLRAGLKVGDKCPICGQQVAHTIPHEDEWKRLYEQAQKIFDDAKNDYDTLQQKLNILAAEEKAKSDAFHINQQNHTNDPSVSNAEQEVIRICTECALSRDVLHSPLNIEQISEALSALTSSQKNEADKLQKQIEQGEAKEKELVSLRKKTTDARNASDKIKNAVSAKKDEITDAVTMKQNAEAVIKSKKQDASTAFNEVQKFLYDLTWHTDWQSQPDLFIQELTNATKKYNENKNDRDRFKGTLENKHKDQQRIQATLEAIYRQMPQWHTITATTNRQVDKLVEKFAELQNEITTANEMIDNSKKQIEEDEKAISNFLIKHPDFSKEHLERLNQYSSSYIQSLRLDIDSIRSALVAKETSWKNVQHSYEEHSQDKPELAQEDTIEILDRSKSARNERIAELQQRMGAIKQQLNEDEQAKQRLQTFIQDAQKKEGVYRQWERLNNLIGDKDGTRFRRIAQSYILANLTEAANVYMQRLTNRYTLHAVPGSFIITVEDAYQGYVSRPTSTISGGESFLVSLALALALSDIGQSLRVATLFIDEGFGTLSGEPLQKAIDTLQSLRKHAGRQVGIISHIDEVRERIPVQIQVTRENNNAMSTINIVG